MALIDYESHGKAWEEAFLWVTSKIMFRPYSIDFTNLSRLLFEIFKNGNDRDLFLNAKNILHGNILIWSDFLAYVQEKQIDFMHRSLSDIRGKDFVTRLKAKLTKDQIASLIRVHNSSTSIKTSMKKDELVSKAVELIPDTIKSEMNDKWCISEISDYFSWVDGSEDVEPTPEFDKFDEDEMIKKFCERLVFKTQMLNRKMDMINSGLKREWRITVSYPHLACGQYANIQKPFDDPFWDEHFPPHPNLSCCCRVTYADTK